MSKYKQDIKEVLKGLEREMDKFEHEIEFVKKLKPRYKIGQKVKYLHDGVNDGWNNDVIGVVREIDFFGGVKKFFYMIDGKGSSGLPRIDHVVESWILEEKNDK